MSEHPLLHLSSLLQLAFVLLFSFSAQAPCVRPPSAGVRDGCSPFWAGVLDHLAQKLVALLHFVACIVWASHRTCCRQQAGSRAACDSFSSRIACPASRRCPRPRTVALGLLLTTISRQQQRHLRIYQWALAGYLRTHCSSCQPAPLSQAAFPLQTEQETRSLPYTWLPYAANSCTSSMPSSGPLQVSPIRQASTAHPHYAACAQSASLAK